jgi:hypothetical protein
MRNKNLLKIPLLALLLNFSNSMERNTSMIENRNFPSLATRSLELENKNLIQTIQDRNASITKLTEQIENMNKVRNITSIQETLDLNFRLESAVNEVNLLKDKNILLENMLKEKEEKDSVNTSRLIERIHTTYKVQNQFLRDENKDLEELNLEQSSEIEKLSWIISQEFSSRISQANDTEKQFSESEPSRENINNSQTSIVTNRNESVYLLEIQEKRNHESLQKIDLLTKENIELQERLSNTNNLYLQKISTIEALETALGEQNIALQDSSVIIENLKKDRILSIANSQMKFKERKELEGRLDIETTALREERALREELSVLSVTQQEELLKVKKENEHLKKKNTYLLKNSNKEVEKIKNLERALDIETTALRYETILRQDLFSQSEKQARLLSKANQTIEDLKKELDSTKIILTSQEENLNNMSMQMTNMTTAAKNSLARTKSNVLHLNNLKSMSEEIMKKIESYKI